MPGPMPPPGPTPPPPPLLLLSILTSPRLAAFTAPAAGKILAGRNCTDRSEERRRQRSPRENVAAGDS
uniref:Secreted protein n=1 Tax=Arundo donax TaxID=35708 RepID=A0A0A9ET52_ARUDO